MLGEGGNGLERGSGKTKDKHLTSVLLGVGLIAPMPFHRTGHRGGPGHLAKVPRGLTLHAVTMEGPTSSELESLAGRTEVSPCSWQVAWESPLQLAELQGPRTWDDPGRGRLKPRP